MKRIDFLKQQIERLRRHPTDECVEWPFSTTGNGYGQIMVNYKRHLVHRLAYELYHKKQPEYCILHVCNNPRCFNISHLYDGTLEENQRDRVLVKQYGVNGIIPARHIHKAKAAINRQRAFYALHGIEDLPHIK